VLFYPNCFGFLSVVFDGFTAEGTDASPKIIPFLPRSASVHMNGYREADTFEIDLDAKAFPFSPDLLRSCAVELFMFQTDGMLTTNLQTHADAGDAWNLSQFQTDDNRVISGLVDEASLHYGDDGRSFRLQGRDYTSLLLNRDWPDGKRVPSDGGFLDDVVQALVDEAVGAKLHGGRTLTVEYLGEEDVAVRAQGRSLTKKTVTIKKTPKVGAHHSKTQKKGFPVRSGRNYWDVIYDLCLRHAKICYVSGNRVIISDPKTLTAQSASSAIRVAYGRNLKSLEATRNMGKEAVPQIVASVYDKKKGVQIEAKWPKTTTPALRQSSQKGKGAADITGVGTVREQTLRVTPPQSITSKELLEAYLKAYYDNVARHEGAIHWQTKALKDLKGDDLLLLRPGDPVRVEFDAFVAEDFRELSEQQRYARMRELGYSQAVAEIVAVEYDRLTQFEAPFYVKDVSFSWSIDQGLEVSVEGINYISPKRDDITA
jgi:hypothetical protein